MILTTPQIEEEIKMKLFKRTTTKALAQKTDQILVPLAAGQKKLTMALATLQNQSVSAYARDALLAANEALTQEYGQEKVDAMVARMPDKAPRGRARLVPQTPKAPAAPAAQDAQTPPAAAKAPKPLSKTPAAPAASPKPTLGNRPALPGQKK